MIVSSGSRVLEVKWISVKDRLPPCAEVVLVYASKSGNRLRGFYLPHGCMHLDIEDRVPGWYEDTLFGFHPRILTEVTHWMELPAGPYA